LFTFKSGKYALIILSNGFFICVTTLFIVLFMVSYGANSGVAISYDSLKKTVPSLLDVESEDLI
jgi:hypothetical protein